MFQLENHTLVDQTEYGNTIAYIAMLQDFKQTLHIIECIISTTLHIDCLIENSLNWGGGEGAKRQLILFT